MGVTDYINEPTYIPGNITTHCIYSEKFRWKTKQLKFQGYSECFPTIFFLQTAQDFLCFYLPFVRFFKQKHLANEASLPSRLNRDRYRNGVHDSTCMHVCTSNSQLAGQKCIEFVLVWYIYNVWWYVTKELGGSEGEAVKMLAGHLGSFSSHRQWQPVILNSSATAPLLPNTSLLYILTYTLTLPSLVIERILPPQHALTQSLPFQQLNTPVLLDLLRSTLTNLVFHTAHGNALQTATGIAEPPKPSLVSHHTYFHVNLRFILIALQHLRAI